MFPGLLIEVDGPVGIITLNRPEQYNALDADLVSALAEALHVMENDAAVGVVVISGAGQNFCSGAIAGLLEAPATGTDYAAQTSPILQEMFNRIGHASKPVVVRVHGCAYGIGAALVAACDIAVATFDTRFTLNEVHHNIPAALVSEHIVRAIGERHTRRYMLSGESFAAAEAYRIGLVHEIVPDESMLDEAVGEIVDCLLRNSRQALAECKQALIATRA